MTSVCRVAVGTLALCGTYGLVSNLLPVRRLLAGQTCSREGLPTRVAQSVAGYAPEVTLLDALYWVCALVLVVSGASKLRDASSTRATMSSLGLPHGAVTGHLVAVTEVLLGAGALMAAPGPLAILLAVLVAATYAAFALVVLAAMRAGLQDCGCIGVRLVRPSALHVVLNLAAALVAMASALQGPVDLVGGLGELPLPAAVASGAVVAVAAGAAVALPGR